MRLKLNKKAERQKRAQERIKAKAFEKEQDLTVMDWSDEEFALGLTPDFD